MSTPYVGNVYAAPGDVEIAKTMGMNQAAFTQWIVDQHNGITPKAIKKADKAKRKAVRTARRRNRQ